MLAEGEGERGGVWKKSWLIRSILAGSAFGLDRKAVCSIPSYVLRDIYYCPTATSMNPRADHAVD